MYGFVRMKPIAMAIMSPTIGNQVSNAAAHPYFSTRLCTFSSFSRFTLKYFSSHSHLHSQPMPKLIIPPMVLPMLATMTITHTLYPNNEAPDTRASDENGIIVADSRQPRKSPNSPRFSSMVKKMFGTNSRPEHYASFLF